MYTKQHSQLGIAQLVLLSYAKALFAYASTDAKFAQRFAKTIISQRWESVPTANLGTHTTHLYPTSHTDALSTAHWIIQSLQTHPEYTTARGTLAHWAHNYELPQAVVFGVVGLAVIGPTLGIINSKKKKKRKSQLVIKESYFQSLSKTKLAILSTQLTQTVIAKETRLAGGNVFNLHPDSAAWCIEEAVTAVYTDSAENLKSLLASAVSEQLSHHVEKSADGTIQAVVISPSVNDSLVEESDAQKV